MRDQFATVSVLDLDDTLYKEVDYRRSGLAAARQFIEQWVPQEKITAIRSLDLEADRDPLAALCREAGLPDSVKESLLWVYRLHIPNIRLSSEVASAIRELQQLGPVAILTDGRSVSQRLKLKALGLDHIPAYISEDYGEEKPAEGRYRRIMAQYPAARYCYVGDNPRKDFVTPNKLGWLTLCLRDNGRNIHAQEYQNADEGSRPAVWIDDFCDVLRHLG